MDDVFEAAFDQILAALPDYRDELAGDRYSRSLACLELARANLWPVELILHLKFELGIVEPTNDVEVRTPPF